MVMAELVGGPVDGQRFMVPEPAPYEWRRYASDVPPVPLSGELPETYTITVTNQPTEQYRRDVECAPDGVWRYRWAGVS